MHNLTAHENKTRRAYWLAQLGGWFSYSLVHYLSYMPALAPGEYLEYLGYRGLAVTEALYIPLGIGASSILGVLYRRLLARRTSWIGVAITAVFGCALMGTVFFLAYRTLLQWFDLLQPGEAWVSWPGAARALLAFTFALLAWTGIWFGVVFWKASQEAQLLAQEARLQMLAYQLNPHFLFNALGSLRALIAEDAVRARTMVSELGEFLRYTLMHRPLEHASLTEELQAIQSYLAIEKIRFEDRLSVTSDVQPAVQNAVVPAFLIHPLVENALRHGAGGTAAQPLELRLGARKDGDQLVIEVWNSGILPPASSNHNAGALVSPPTQRNAGTGTGLTNVRARLETLFPGKHRFTLVEDGGGVLARIEIPLVLR